MRILDYYCLFFHHIMAGVGGGLFKFVGGGGGVIRKNLELVLQMKIHETKEKKSTQVKNLVFSLVSSVETATAHWNCQQAERAKTNTSLCSNINYVHVEAICFQSIFHFSDLNLVQWGVKFEKKLMPLCQSGRSRHKNPIRSAHDNHCIRKKFATIFAWNKRDK